MERVAGIQLIAFINLFAIYHSGGGQPSGGSRALCANISVVATI